MDALKNGFVGAKVALGDTEFNKLSSFINTNYGIKLPPAKKVMLEGRLQKRLKATRLHSFSDYLDYVFSEEGKSEIIHMIDQVSTNKTDFFREPAHFDFLNNHILPEHQKYSSRNPIKIWSSAASSGEEIYTIGFSIEEFNDNNNNRLDYSILGTDISVEILKKAVSAIYSEERIVNIPLELKRKYFLKSKDQLKKTVRVISQLRQKSKFQRLNLMDNSYNVPDNFDVIFCRNVLIYFDKKTQEDVVRKQCMKLRKDGYFLLGHSESIMGLDLPLKQIQPTIYKKI